MYGALDVRTDGRTYYVRTAVQLLLVCTGFEYYVRTAVQLLLVCTGLEYYVVRTGYVHAPGCVGGAHFFLQFV